MKTGAGARPRESGRQTTPPRVVGTRGGGGEGDGAVRRRAGGVYGRAGGAGGRVGGSVAARAPRVARRALRRAALSARSRWAWSRVEPARRNKPRVVGAGYGGNMTGALG